MSEPIKDYDTKLALKMAGIEQPTVRDFQLIDRFFMIYEGNVQKTGLALKKYLAAMESL